MGTSSSSKVSESPIFLAFLRLTVFLLLSVLGAVVLSVILTLFKIV
jgi:hypothetical protein